MNRKKVIIKFYEKCVEKGYTDMSSEDQRLDAKVVAADFGLKYKDIGDLFNEAKAEAERLKIDGKLITTIYSEKMAVGVFMRPDNSVYSVLNKDQRIEGAPRIDVKQGGMLNYTYHPSKAIYTGATVGGITTGGVEYTKAGYSEKVGNTGTGYIDISIGGETFVVNSITFSPLIRKRFKRDASFNHFVDKSGCVACKKHQPYLNDRVSMALSSRNYMDTMSLLSGIADSERLPYSQCVEIANLLGRVVNANLPPLDEDVYSQAVSLLASGNPVQVGQAEKLLLGILDYKDATNLIYRRAVELSGSETSAEMTHAIELFNAISDYKDSKSLAQKAGERLDDILHEEKRNAIIEKENHRKRIKRVVAIGAIAVVAVAVLALVISQIIVPANRYNNAVKLLEAGDYDGAIAGFTELGDYKDSATRIDEAKEARKEAAIVAKEKQFEAQNQALYDQAVTLETEGELAKAAITFGGLNGFSDAHTRSLDLWNQIAVRKTIDAGAGHTVGLKSDGTVVAYGSTDSQQCEVSDWSDIVAISAGNYNTVGLKSNGTVINVGENIYGNCDTSDWTDMVAVAGGGEHLTMACQVVGIRLDGTVLAVGSNDYGQCNVLDWTDIAMVDAGSGFTVGLRVDGTVVATGNNEYGQCNVKRWTDVVSISVGSSHTVALKADGTVVATGSNKYGQCNVDDWTNIVAVASGCYHTVGLKADGTVIATGENKDGQCDVDSWTDIVEIASGYDHTVGLKSDGTAVAVGKNFDGQCEVSGWTNIRIPN